MSEEEFSGGPEVNRVAALVLPILADLGLELYDCSHQGGTIQVLVTRQRDAADKTLDLDVIALVTRLLSRELDHHDPIPGRYTLEVSSPGLERPLRRPAHYRDAVGVPVALRLNEPVHGTRRINGTLVEADDDSVLVRPDAADSDVTDDVRLTYAQIEKARTVFRWEPTPKPGKGTPRAKPGRSRPQAQPADAQSTTTTTQAGAS